MSIFDVALAVGLVIGGLCALVAMAGIAASEGVLGLLLRGKRYDWERES